MNTTVFCDGWMIYPVRTFKDVGLDGPEIRVEFHAFSEDSYDPRKSYGAGPSACFSLPEMVLREPSPRYSILAALRRQREYKVWDRSRRHPANIVELSN